jgi:hypothetical protein
VPILLNLERIIHGGTFDNFVFIIIRSLVIFGGMSETDTINNFFCFVVDSVIVFQSLKICATI